MTVKAVTTERERDQHDPYRSPGRITQVEELHDRRGVSVARVYFEDGRWLEVIGASRGWPQEV